MHKKAPLLRDGSNTLRTSAYDEIWLHNCIFPSVLLGVEISRIYAREWDLHTYWIKQEKFTLDIHHSKWFRTVVIVHGLIRLIFLRHKKLYLPLYFRNSCFRNVIRLADTYELKRTQKWRKFWLTHNIFVSDNTSKARVPAIHSSLISAPPFVELYIHKQRLANRNWWSRRK